MSEANVTFILPLLYLYRTLIEILSRERPKQGGGNVKKTDHYSHEMVKKYLELYPDPADKIQVIECIRMSLSIEDCGFYDGYFKRLEQEIKEQQKSQSVNISGEHVHQTININTAQQVNINPKEVVNHTKEE